MNDPDTLPGPQHGTPNRRPRAGLTAHAAHFAAVAGQPAAKYEVSSMSWRALACTRKERPTRTAGNSPLCTSRYTVILETRISAATSATVRNCVLACWPSTEPESRPLAAESRADGPLVDVIATQSCQARAMPAASPPLAPTRAYKEENSGTSGVNGTGEGQSIRKS